MCIREERDNIDMKENNSSNSSVGVKSPTNNTPIIFPPGPGAIDITPQAPAPMPPNMWSGMMGPMGYPMMGMNAMMGPGMMDPNMMMGQVKLYIFLQLCSIGKVM